MKHCGPILIWTQCLHFWGSWLILILQANGEMGLPLTGSDEVDRVSSCFLPFCQLLHANLASTAFYRMHCSVAFAKFDDDGFWAFHWIELIVTINLPAICQFSCVIWHNSCQLSRFLSSVLSLIIWLITLPPFGVVSLSAYHHDVLFCGGNGFSRL